MKSKKPKPSLEWKKAAKKHEACYKSLEELAKAMQNGLKKKP